MIKFPLSLAVCLLFGALLPANLIAASSPWLAAHDPSYGRAIPKLINAPSTTPANWIWSAKLEADSTVYARGIVTLVAPIKLSYLYATGDDGYTAYVNGVKVGSGNQWQTVQKYDTASLLHVGNNVVAIQGVNAGGAAGLLAELVVDGKVVLQTDSRWKISGASTPPSNWYSPAFDSFVWNNAVEEAPVGKGVWGPNIDGWINDSSGVNYLAHIAIAPKAIEVLSGSVVRTDTVLRTGKANLQIEGSPTTAAKIRIDFGEELAGRLILLGTPNTKVTINTGETIAELTTPEPALDNSGPFDRVVDASDDNTPVTTPYSAFRYALITFPAGESAVITSLLCDDKYYPVTYRGDFDCSDPLLTKIWDEGAYTSLLCMQEQIWDAPKRDRGLWCGDMHVSGEVINDVFLDKFLMELSIGELRDIAQNGQPPTALPTSEINTLPGYTAAWFCELADFYRHVGDDAFLKKEHENIITLLEFQRGDFDANNLFVNPRHLWNFVDWAPDFVLDSTPNHMATDLFDIKGIREAVFLLMSLGDVQNAVKYDAWANTLAAAAQTNYAGQTRQTFGDRLQPNVMAIYSGTATPAQEEVIYQRILAPDSSIWTPQTKFAGTDAEVMSPYFGNYVLLTLAKLNKDQDGIDLIRRYWGAMVARGQTTLWEKFDTSYPEDYGALLQNMPYISFSHGWSAGPTSYLSENVLGVRPTSGGFKTADIVPFLGNLSWIKGDVPTPQGSIHVEAQRQSEGESIVVTVPSGVVASVGINSAAATVNGKKVVIARSSEGISYIVIDHAGRYHFVVAR